MKTKTLVYRIAYDKRLALALFTVAAVVAAKAAPTAKPEITPIM